jgi:hypothetical protein
LTVSEVWVYKAITDEGGGAAGDRRTRSRENLLRVARVTCAWDGVLGDGLVLRRA